MNAYFICVIVHVQMWCVYSIACRSNPKRFLSIFYVFESVLHFRVLSFWSNCIFLCFSSKTSLKAFSQKSSQLNSFHETGLRQNMKTQNSDKNFCNCHATVSRVKSSREKFCALEAFFESNFARNYPTKNACFQF